jgi:hypothetical protein
VHGGQVRVRIAPSERRDGAQAVEAVRLALRRCRLGDRRTPVGGPGRLAKHGDVRRRARDQLLQALARLGPVPVHDEQSAGGELGIDGLRVEELGLLGMAPQVRPSPGRVLVIRLDEAEVGPRRCGKRLRARRVLGDRLEGELLRKLDVAAGEQRIIVE